MKRWRTASQLALLPRRGDNWCPCCPMKWRDHFALCPLYGRALLETYR